MVDKLKLESREREAVDALTRTRGRSRQSQEELLHSVLIPSLCGRRLCGAHQGIVK